MRGLDTGFVCEIVHQYPLRLVVREPRRPLQPDVLFRDQALELGLAGVEPLRLLVQVPLQYPLLPLLLPQELDLPVDVLFADLYRLLLSLELCLFALDIAVKILLLLVPFVLDFKELLPLERVRLLFRVGQDLPGLLSGRGDFVLAGPGV